MTTMTTNERFKRIFEHKEADRIPIYDRPWDGTLMRWKREGLPENVDYTDYFNIDKIAYINVDASPRYEIKVLEETDDYIVKTTDWGVTLKYLKEVDSTPDFLDFTITDPDKWLQAKKRMIPSKDRIPWSMLEANYKKWREEGRWIVNIPGFGFDMTHNWIVGTERVLIALIEEPEWCMDMFNSCLDMNLVLLDMVWDAGYEFDCFYWMDDLGYKNSQFFSVDTYRELLKPTHKRAVEWAHHKGIKASIHSCGDVNPFIPEFIDIGVDSLNPLEVKAGMDPVEIKQKYGKDIVLHGGINAVLWDNIDAIKEEMNRIIPVMKQSGGYIFSSDHSIPSSVSFENFREIIRLVKELGHY